MNDLVSVIVPVYNREKYEKRCIESIINQTHKNIEVLLIDDGSTDHSRQLLEDYAKKDSRVHVFHKENEGLGPTRNYGISKANGEWLFFVDADDYIDLEMVGRLLDKCMVNHLEVCYGQMKRELANGKTESWACELKQDLFCEKEIVPAILYNMLRIENPYVVSGGIPCSCCAILYSRELFQDGSLRFVSEREYATEDTIFCIQFIPRCKRVGVISDTFYHYCCNEGTLSQGYHPEHVEQLQKAFELCKNMIQSHEEIVEKEKVMDGLNQLMFNYIRMKMKQEIREHGMKSRQFATICNNPWVQELAKCSRVKASSKRNRLFASFVVGKQIAILRIWNWFKRNS